VFIVGQRVLVGEVEWILEEQAIEHRERSVKLQGLSHAGDGGPLEHCRAEVGFSVLRPQVSIGHDFNVDGLGLDGLPDQRYTSSDPRSSPATRPQRRA
jgi:hypothetical protein